MKNIWTSIRESTPKDGEWVIARFTIGSLSKQPQLFRWDNKRDQNVVNTAPDLSWMLIPPLDAKADEEAEEAIREAEPPEPPEVTLTEAEIASAAAAVKQQLPKAKKPKRISRGDRWLNAASDAENALSDLQDIQQEYQDWYDNLPENLQGSALGEKLQAVTELDISSALDTVQEAGNTDLPLGFGRD